MRRFALPGLLLFALILGFFTAHHHIARRDRTDCWFYELRLYVQWHNKVLGSPWQERALWNVLFERTAWTLDGILHKNPIMVDVTQERDGKETAIQGTAPGSFILTMVIFKYSIHAAIFVLLALYLRMAWFKAGLNMFLLGIYAWMLSFQNDITSMFLWSYGEILILLVLPFILNSGRLWLLVPLTIVGMLAKETAIFIPVIAGAWGIICFPKQTGRWMKPVVVSFVLATLIFFILRYYYAQTRWLSYSGYPHPFGPFSFLFVNVGSTGYWGKFLIPCFFLALGYKAAPPWLRAFSIGMIPGWVAFNLLFGHVYEARPIMAPIALVGLPLFGIFLNNLWKQGGLKPCPA